MTEPIDAAGVRVLGSLIEKEATTPDNYPLTLNALTSACNQSSNRDPVMSLEEGEVARALDELKRRKLVNEVYRSDSRAKRYRHVLSESLSLHTAETAVMGVLMLRGPQTTGEIRTRTARIFEFIDLAHVEITLQALMSLDPPLVTQLPRRPGQKEVRYAHLLSGEPEDVYMPDAEVATPRVSQPSRVDALEAEVAALRAEVAELKEKFEEFRQQFQ